MDFSTFMTPLMTNASTHLVWSLVILALSCLVVASMTVWIKALFSDIKTTYHVGEPPDSHLLLASVLGIILTVFAMVQKVAWAATFIFAAIWATQSLRN